MLGCPRELLGGGEEAMVEKTLDSVRERFAALKQDEEGMEAAQVILILILVVIALIPMFTFVRNRIGQAGSSAGSQIR